MNKNIRKLILSLLAALAIGAAGTGCTTSPDAGMAGEPAAYGQAVSQEQNGNPWHTDGSTSSRWANPWQLDHSDEVSAEGENPWKS